MENYLRGISIIMERNYIITEDTGMLLPYFRNIWNCRMAGGKTGWDACRHGAYCMYRIGDRDRALKFLLSGLSEGIPKPELCCGLGWWSSRPKAAIATQFSGTWAGSSGRKVDRGGRFCDAGVRGYVPYLQMCVCYDRLGEWKTAERYNELARGARPGTETCQLNRKYFEKEKHSKIERRQ